MGEKETKTLLNECATSDTAGAATTFPIQCGTVTFEARTVAESPGDNTVYIEGSNDEGDNWLTLMTIVLSASVLHDSGVIFDTYRQYRALTGTLAADNAVTVLGTGKGPYKG